MNCSWKSSKINFLNKNNYIILYVHGKNYKIKKILKNR